METIEAPFAPSIAVALNQSQVGIGKGMVIHPYTCANRGDGLHGEEGGDLGVLIATASGWVCPHCDYTQATAHPMMASTRPSGLPDWLQKSREDAVPEMTQRRLEAYQALKLERPNAPGLDDMIQALELRAKELEPVPLS